MPSGRPSSRRRACRRPCPCRARPGPSSRRPRRWPRATRRRRRRRPGRACRRRGRSRGSSSGWRARTSGRRPPAPRAPRRASRRHLGGDDALQVRLERDDVDDLHALAVGGTTSRPRYGLPSTVSGCFPTNVSGGSSACPLERELRLERQGPGSSAVFVPVASMTLHGAVDASVVFAFGRAAPGRSRRAPGRASCPCSSARGSRRTSSRASRSRTRPTGSSRGRGPSRGR